ncbi:MAG: DUF1844 domain-containing protein [Silvibacterium sp.]
MSEKPPVFTVTDRRKFTLEGELRDEDTQPTASEEAAKPEPVPEPASGPRLVTMPPPKSPEHEVPELETSVPETAPEENADTPPEVSAQDEAAAHHAYQQSSEHIDTMLRAANPGAGAPPAVTIEHVIQSVYLSAIVALGAATEPGQKPRIDLLGARQNIDMLGVLQEKTKGNLSEKEQRLLQNALFEVRMMFLEVTNALAQQAARPPQGKK